MNIVIRCVFELEMFLRNNGLLVSWGFDSFDVLDVSINIVIVILLVRNRKSGYYLNLGDVWLLNIW